MPSPERIAIVGPESTGKTSTANYLAEKLSGCLVIEKARSYLDEINRPYKEEDLLIIARLQAEEESKCNFKSAFPYVICDTNLLVIKIWSLHKYNRCHPWIEEELLKSHYDLYLLSNIDMPWEEDPQREHPNMREYFFNWYHKVLIEMNVNYEIVTGQGEKRFSNALELIRPLKYRTM